MPFLEKPIVAVEFPDRHDMRLCVCFGLSMERCELAS
jgi:hypothetical protein